jgi:hypothetical protein
MSKYTSIIGMINNINTVPVEMMSSLYEQVHYIVVIRMLETSISLISHVDIITTGTVNREDTSVASTIHLTRPIGRSDVVLPSTIIIGNKTKVPAVEILQLHDSTNIYNDQLKLRTILQRDGVILLRGVVKTNLLQSATTNVIQVLHDLQLLPSNSNPPDPDNWRGFKNKQAGFTMNLDDER